MNSKSEARPSKAKLKNINDPIYGFITIPDGLLHSLIEHPYFQRLRRISQMGMSYLVFPGAHHTRFHHALGAMYLMQQAVRILRRKEVPISDEEAQALYIAILLHDVGHGPFSHAMEHSIVDDITHEEISLHFMQALNEEFEGELDLAIAIFKDEYERKFLHQLVSGQLDMDRLDYLRRDSFYTGVAEGTVNSMRLINMLNVHNDRLVVEAKAIYSVEKFIVARRLMYWQVYLHKAGVVAEQLLVRILQRAKELIQQGVQLEAGSDLSFFLKNSITTQNFDRATLQRFARLDDHDVMAAIKSWVDSDDFVLKELCTMLLNRDLLKIKLSDKPISEKKLQKRLQALADRYELSESEAAYFAFTGVLHNQAYRKDEDAIYLLKSSGKVVEMAAASDQLNIEALSQTVTKYYLCYPKTSD